MVMTPRAQKTQLQMLPFLEPVGTVVDPLDDAVVCSAVTIDPHNLLLHLHVCDHALPALSSPTNPHKYLFRGKIAIALWDLATQIHVDHLHQGACDRRVIAERAGDSCTRDDARFKALGNQPAGRYEHTRRCHFA